MSDNDSSWSQKGATLSDKSAQKEFGLTHEAIVAAIRAGKLQFRKNSAHGNPYLRLLRLEVEAFVREQHGKDHLRKKKLQNELAEIKSEARKLNARLKAIQRRQAELLAELNE